MDSEAEGDNWKAAESHDEHALVKYTSLIELMESSPSNRRDKSLWRRDLRCFKSAPEVPVSNMIHKASWEYLRNPPQQRRNGFFLNWVWNELKPPVIACFKSVFTKIRSTFSSLFLRPV